MKKAGLVLSLISLVTVFFHYNIAVLLFSIALIAFGIADINQKNSATAWIYITTGLGFIIGICVMEIIVIRS